MNINYYNRLINNDNLDISLNIFNMFDSSYNNYFDSSYNIINDIRFDQSGNIVDEYGNILVNYDIFNNNHDIQINNIIRDNNLYNNENEPNCQNEINNEAESYSENETNSETESYSENNIDDKYNKSIETLLNYNISHPILFKLWSKYLNLKKNQYEKSKNELLKSINYANNTISNINNGALDIPEEHIILLLIYSQYLSNNNI